MKIAHFGNLANDAFPIVEALRERQYEADLYIYRPSHVCSLPQWEVCDLDARDIGDPYNPDWEVLNKTFNQPSWMHVLNFGANSSKLSRLWKVIHAMRKYDFIVAHVPFSKYVYFSRKPYIPYDAGAIRYLDWKNLGMRLVKFGYSRAKVVIMTNPDTRSMFERYGFKYRFIQFLINTSRYKPAKQDESLPYEYIFFMPSRQQWTEKGNNFFIEAFSRFLKEHRDSILVMCEWGTDLPKTKELIKKLGIERSVMWLPLMSKPRLTKWYNLSTVVADQFVVGSCGTCTLEAMACEKPVIVYVSHEYYLKAYGEVPPVVNARTQEEILDAMVKCADSSFRNYIGKLSREWVKKHQNSEIVVEKHLTLMSEVLQK